MPLCIFLLDSMMIEYFSKMLRFTGSIWISMERNSEYDQAYN